MQRSLYSAVSGMSSNQTKMDVVGNNIANVNTSAFKAERVRFEDLMSQTLAGASAPQENRGGVNPQQVGLGVSIAAIDTNHSQGSMQNTGQKNDLAVEGEGHFVVSDGRSDYYTRDGAFSLDSRGNLVNSSNGLELQGWGVNEDGTIDTTEELQSMQVPVEGQREASPTGYIDFAGNLDANGEEVEIFAVAYDSLGHQHEVKITFSSTEETGEWDWEAHHVGEDETLVGEGIIGFSSEGGFMEHVNIATGEENEDESIRITMEEDSVLETGANDLEIDLNFTSLTQLVAETDAGISDQDGYPPEALEDFSVDENGVVEGIYANGMIEVLGQVALANFSNPSGLSKEGNNLFQATTNSGEPALGRPNQESLGSIQASTLEMSNVDLADQFTEMITTSRAFQANSRVISSVDEMLTEVVNLKR